MGSFNIVRAPATCPQCQSSIEVRVQFKYGDTWQHEYGIGDTLRWGGNDIGRPGKESVVVDGIAENACPKCGFDEEWSFYVFVDRDVVVRVTEADGRFDFVAVHESYLVLRE